tara:strand:- start:1354 stop:1593 length:240 start_codon:yes stop_codon:yes gene_type:complete
MFYFNIHHKVKSNQLLYLSLEVGDPYPFLLPLTLFTLDLVLFYLDSISANSLLSASSSLLILLAYSASSIGAKSSCAFN